MTIISYPERPARMNAIARVLASFVAHLHREASSSPRFDVRECARTVLLAGVDLGELVSADGDALLSELLEHAARLERERKGGAA